MNRLITTIIILTFSTGSIIADELWTSWTASSFEINPEIIAMVIDSKDCVWVSHYSRSSSSVLRDGEWNLVQFPLGKLLGVDKNDVVWGAWSVLNSYDGVDQKKHSIYYGSEEGDPEHEWYTAPGQCNSLLFTSNNEAWLGASFIEPYSSYGLFQLHMDQIVDGYKITADRFVIIPPGWDGTGVLTVGVYDIAVDSTGLLWLGTDHNLWIYDGNTLVNCDDINKAVNARLGNDYVYYTNDNVFQTIDLLIDKSDRIWFIAQPLYWAFPNEYEDLQNMVIVCYDNGNIIFYDHTNCILPELGMNDILIDQKDILWVGTETGLYSFNGEDWGHYTIENSGLCDDRVRCLAAASDNTLWIGTYNGVSRFIGNIVTSVDEENQKPESLPLITTYPNPFNPSTTIEFTLPESDFATITIYSMAGQKIRDLAADFMPAGTHTLLWDGRDASGNTVSSGIYITRLQAGKHTATGRMVLMK